VCAPKIIRLRRSKNKSENVRWPGFFGPRCMSNTLALSGSTHNKLRATKFDFEETRRIPLRLSCGVDIFTDDYLVLSQSRV